MAHIGGVARPGIEAVYFRGGDQVAFHLGGFRVVGGARS
jgi:hypothetical protein